MNNSGYGLVWLILGLPLVGFLIQAFLGKRVILQEGLARGRRLMGTLAVLPIALAFVVGLVLTIRLMGEAPEARHHISTLFNWIDLQSIRIPFEALVDPLSMTMVLIITGIGSLIHLYATGYMGEEKDYSRFFTYMNLFVACMLILVLANNLVLMFIGWEGVGLCSYLLIAFWYKDVDNAKAGNKAFIVNRIGDWGLTLGMFLIFSVLSTHRNGLPPDVANRFLSYDVMLPHAAQLFGAPGVATAIALLLFIGACGKSAQFPLYFWLPDAMAGPTPVSALIHAATMVTSGVFLVNRLHVFYEMSPVASAVVVCIGAFTALFAALIAFGQMDIKKVLAYSTVSQLGYMFIGCGAGAYWAGMFHVTTHAFFKALLFLGAGAVIHSMAHNQDMRNYGNLLKYLKITGWTMIIAFLAIAAIWPFAGFYSKEAILGAAFGNSQAVTDGLNLGIIAGWVGLFTAMLTAWYMARLTMLTFFSGEERWRAIPVHVGHHAHDEGSATSSKSTSKKKGKKKKSQVSEVRGPAQSAKQGQGTSGKRQVIGDRGPEEGAKQGQGARDKGQVIGDKGQVAELVTIAAEESSVGEPVTHRPSPVTRHPSHDAHEDVHGFFYTEAELAKIRESEHEAPHHELDKNHEPHEAPPSMTLPLIVLAVLSVIGGFVLSYHEGFRNWLYPEGKLAVLPANIVPGEPEHLPLTLLSLIAGVLGIVIGYVVYRNGLPKGEGWDLSRWSPFRRSAANQFGYDAALVNSGLEGGGEIGNGLWRIFDAGVIDGIVNGIGWLAMQFGAALRKIQTGYVRNYAMSMTFGGLLILVIAIGLFAAGAR